MNPSKNVTVQVPYFLKEYSMSANQPWVEMRARRLVWTSEKSGDSLFQDDSSSGTKIFWLCFKIIILLCS